MNFRKYLRLSILLVFIISTVSLVQAQQIYPNQAGQITIDNAETMRLMAYYNLPSVREVVWSPGNLRLAVSAENQVFIFNTFNLSETPVVITHDQPIWDMAFNPDGSVLAVTSENELRLWRAVDGNLFRSPSVAINANDIDYSNDGSLIAYTDPDDGGLKLWNTLEDSIIELGYPSREDDGFFNVDFSDDNQYVGTLSLLHEFAMYDLQRGRLVGNRILSNRDFYYGELWHDVFSLQDYGHVVYASHLENGVATSFLEDVNSEDNLGYLLTDFSESDLEHPVSLSSSDNFVVGAHVDSIYLLPYNRVNFDQSYTQSNIVELPHPAVSSTTFSSDGTQLASVGGDEIRLWRAEADLFTRPQLGGFSQQVVDTICDSDNEPSIRNSLTTSASWSWFASTQEQLLDHIYNGQYQILFDGNPVTAWTFLSAPEQQNGDWVVYYYMPTGQLPWGRHGFMYELSWRDAISDGYDDYGPDTANETDAGQCIFTITQD